MKRAVVSLALGCALVARAAHADPPPAPSDGTAAAPAVAAEGAPPAVAPAAPSPAMAKARYSLPWALRPAIAPNLLRLDSVVALQDKATTSVTSLLGGYKPTRALPDFGIYGRVAFVHQAPDASANGSAISNPLVFALYTPQIAPGVRLALFAGATLPIGQGGGSTPTPTTRAAVGAGIYARSAMDNALFAVNYVTPTVGVGLAYVDKGLTLQGEATVLQLVRVRGDALDAEGSRTNFTAGAHAGYLMFGVITASVELRYQHWLSTPAIVAKDSKYRAQATAGLGLRANIPLSRTILARPGFAYFHPIDDPMSGMGYRILHLDVPIAF